MTSTSEWDLKRLVPQLTLQDYYFLRFDPQTGTMWCLCGKFLSGGLLNPRKCDSDKKKPISNRPKIIKLKTINSSCFEVISDRLEKKNLHTRTFLCLIFSFIQKQSFVFKSKLRRTKKNKNFKQSQKSNWNKLGSSKKRKQTKISAKNLDSQKF